jgi:hypothetical protein
MTTTRHNRVPDGPTAVQAAALQHVESDEHHEGRGDEAEELTRTCERVVVCSDVDARRVGTADVLVLVEPDLRVGAEEP